MRDALFGHFCPQCGQLGVFWEFQSGVKIEGELSLLRSLSLKAYTQQRKK